MTDSAKLIETIRQAQGLRVQRLRVGKDGSFEVEFFPAPPPVAPPARSLTKEELAQARLDADLSASEGA